MTTAPGVRLGLRENAAQFSLLVAVNAFVGMMVGLERATLPLVGRDDFHLGSSAAVLSFIVAFGVAKALTNLAAGSAAARVGRRRLLIAGWAVALPVPLLIAAAHRAWGWIVAANHQPGTRLVHDRRHEDRPRRAQTPRSRSASTSPRATAVSRSPPD